VQIPVFYALYKVLMVTIEMRHQPFILWIKDLSAPDPLHILNLFGLLDFTPPAFLGIGVLALLLGLSMWLQFRLNPTPMEPPAAGDVADAVDDDVHFMAPFAAGLLVYWITSNFPDDCQQTWLYSSIRSWRAAAGNRVSEEEVSGDEPAEDLIEPARKLFAGPVTFLKSAPDLKFLPDADAPEVAFRGPLECRQVVAASTADQSQQPGAHLEHAGADPGAQLLRRRRGGRSGVP